MKEISEKIKKNLPFNLFDSNPLKLNRLPYLVIKKR